MTLAELQQRLADYLAAEQSVLKSQEYNVGQGSTARRLRRADLEQIRLEIKALQEQINLHPDNPARIRRRGAFYLVPR